MRLFAAVYPSPEALDDITGQVARLRVGEAAASGINVRITARDTLHVTIVFLGEVDDGRLPDVTAALGRAAATWRRRADIARAGEGVRRPRIRPEDAVGPGGGVPGIPPGGAVRPGDLRRAPGVAPQDTVGPDGGAPGIPPEAVVGPQPGAGPPRVRLAGGGRFGRGRFTVLWAGLAGDVAALRALNAAARRELKRSRLPHDWRPFRPHVTLARPGDRVERNVVDADREMLNGYFGPSWPVTEMVLVRSHLGSRPTYERVAAWAL